MYNLREVRGGFSIAKCMDMQNIVHTIPAEYEGKKIVSIDKGAFSECVNIEKLIIEPSIHFLPKKVFDSTTIKEILFKNPLYTIPKYAFQNSCLEYINIPSVVRIEHHAFKDSKLNKFNLPATLVQLESQVFGGTPLEQKGRVDSTLYKYTGNELFYMTKGIHILLPRSLSDNGLNTVIVCEETQKLFDQVFAGNSSINRVDFYNTLIELPTNTFLDCRHLSTVLLPNGLERIGEGAFSGTYNLTKIALPSTVSQIKFKSFAYSSLESLDAPNVRYVDKWAFEKCENLKEVDLRGAYQIHNSAFANCINLTTLHINKRCRFKGYLPNTKIIRV